MIQWYTALWLSKEKKGEFAGYVLGCRELAPLMSEDTSLPLYRETIFCNVAKAHRRGWKLVKGCGIRFDIKLPIATHKVPTMIMINPSS